MKVTDANALQFFLAAIEDVATDLAGLHEARLDRKAGGKQLPHLARASQGPTGQSQISERQWSGFEGT